VKVCVYIYTYIYIYADVRVYMYIIQLLNLVCYRFQRGRGVATMCGSNCLISFAKESYKNQGLSKKRSDDCLITHRCHPISGISQGRNEERSAVD